MTEVFRAIHNKNFTVVSNYYLLKDFSLSAKAKGILTIMLALPETWEYTIKGLATMVRDGVDSVRTGLKELESAGYLVRSRERTEKGYYKTAVYIISEEPHLSETAFSFETENPMQDKPAQEKKPLSSTIKTINNDVNISENHAVPENTKSITDIKQQINYNRLTDEYNKEYADLAVAVVQQNCNRLSAVIGGKRRDDVKHRFEQLSYCDIATAGNKINNRKIGNVKAYLTAVLYNGTIASANTEKKTVKSCSFDVDEIMRQSMKKYQQGDLI